MAGGRIESEWKRFAHSTTRPAQQPWLALTTSLLHCKSRVPAGGLVEPSAAASGGEAERMRRVVLRRRGGHGWRMTLLDRRGWCAAAGARGMRAAGPVVERSAMAWRCRGVCRRPGSQPSAAAAAGAPCQPSTTMEGAWLLRGRRRARRACSLCLARPPARNGCAVVTMSYRRYVHVATQYCWPMSAR